MNDKLNLEDSEQQRLDYLVSLQLSDELGEAEIEELVELLNLFPEARQRLVASSLFDVQLADVLRSEACQHPRSAPIPNRKRRFSDSWSGAILVAAALVLALLATQWVLDSQESDLPEDEQIARITGLSGPLQWTGNGGLVTSELMVGAELPGGTIEGQSPESWFELMFKDGSRVVIAGQSRLVFSDQGQKELHLIEGGFSASVEPQPAGKPMLVYTRTAVLEVLGTEFEVASELASTFLNVTKGKVRVKRLSDGQSLDVPAKHRVTAAADQLFELEPTPETVGFWKDRLARGPKGVYGTWQPGDASEGRKPAVKSIPHTVKESGKTIYCTSLRVISGDSPPVVLRRDSQLVVEGRIAKKTKSLYVGVTLQHPNGGFAGRFQIRLSGKSLPINEKFELDLDVQNFTLDPSLREIQHKLADSPLGLIVTDIWCHTLWEPAGLEIEGVELYEAASAD
ncbi:MAG: FecR family protein [Mariniblastus sp.]|nr:FecR family protein [Mariniblastus sp.]